MIEGSLLPSRVAPPGTGSGPFACDARPTPSLPGGVLKIVVGLGNPGDQYAKTRHNIGWMVLDRLADRAGWAGKGRTRDASAVAMGRFHGMDLTLVKPLTWMNDSGLAVRKVLARQHAPLVDLLVVTDDFSLPSASSASARAAGRAATTASARSSTSWAPRSSAGCGSGSARPSAASRTTSSTDSSRTSGSGSTSCSTRGPTRSRSGPATGRRRRRTASTCSSSGRPTRRGSPPRARSRSPRIGRDPPDADRLAAGAAAAGRRVTSSTASTMRGRRGRDRRIAEAASRSPGSGAGSATGARRLPDLSALPPLLGATGSLASLRER